MELEDKNKIIENLNYVVENTSNHGQLLVLLFEKRLLESSEYQDINAKSTAYEKSAQLYTTVMKKGEVAFEILITCLTNSGNKAIADKLQNYTIENKSLIWHDIDAPTKIYKGRKEEIETIYNCHLQTFSDNLLTFVAITGLGGIGKSELTRIYANKFYKEIGGCCIWINAESSNTIFNSFSKLATNKKINVALKHPGGTEKNVDSLCKDVYEKLSKQKCLYIFDNLESYEIPFLKSFASHFFTRPPTEMKPFVIVTSRYKLVNETFGYNSKHIALDVLLEQDAIDFFIEALEVEEEENTIANLKIIAKKLMYFPLAMQQTVAYLNSKKRYSKMQTEIKDYIIAFEKKGKELLTHPLPTILDHNSKTTFVTWKITLEKIENLPGVGTKAGNTLRLVSFLQSDNIDIEFINKLTKLLFPEPVGFFSMVRKRFKFSAEDDVDIIQILDDYSMVKKSKFEERFVISIHRLVQEVTRIQMQEKSLLSQLLDRLLEIITEMMANKEIPVSEMIHVESVWSHAAKSEELSKKYQDFPETIFQKYFSSGRYREALEFWSVPFEILKLRFGEENRCPLEMMFRKGALLEKTGEYDKAIETLELVYQKQKMTFGDTDHDSLKSAGYIGQVHWRKRDYSSAIQCFQNVIEKREQMSEKDTDEILNLKISQGLVLVDQGNHDDALKLYQYVLPLKEKRCGKDSLAILPLLNNIAQAKFEQEKYEEALQEFTHVLHLREQLLEVDHLSTLRTRFWVTEIYSRLGRKEEALTFGKETYEKQKCVIGDGHPLAVRTKTLIDDLKNLTIN